MLVVLSGPSGVGKDSVIGRMRELDPEIVYSVSTTTRPPRAGEVEGVHYNFVSDQEFDRLVAADEFLEWATVHGQRYGTPRRRLEEARSRPVILKIDVQGAERLRTEGIAAFYIFLVPPSEAELIRRLTDRRTESADSLARREADARAELAQARRYDCRVINADLDTAAREVLAAIAARHAEPGSTESRS